MKTEAYARLASLNQAYAQALRDLSALEQLKVVRQGPMRSYESRTEELRAEINRHATGTLNGQEERDLERPRRLLPAHVLGRPVRRHGRANGRP